MITGATGYVGSMLINRIKNKTGDKVIVLVRNPEKLADMGITDIEIVKADLVSREEMKKLSLDIDYVFHCVSITKSFEMVNHPVEVIASIVSTTQNVLDLAYRCHAKSFVYVSSMEVYGNIDCSDGHRVCEDEMGYVDLANVRSCYPMGKRMAENLCVAYYKEYGVPIKIARLAQTFGKGVLKEDNRVYKQFVLSAKKGENIVLHTKGNSVANYCGIEDTVDGLFTILERGTNGEAYNIVNEDNTMMIREVAKLVCNKIADSKIEVVYDIPEDNKYGYAADTGLRMSAGKLRKLGWVPKQTLEDMFMDVKREIDLN